MFLRGAAYTLVCTAMWLLCLSTSCTCTAPPAPPAPPASQRLRLSDAPLGAQQHLLGEEESHLPHSVITVPYYQVWHQGSLTVGEKGKGAGKGAQGGAGKGAQGGAGKGAQGGAGEGAGEGAREGSGEGAWSMKRGSGSRANLLLKTLSSHRTLTEAQKDGLRRMMSSHHRNDMRQQEAQLLATPKFMRHGRGSAAGVWPV